jgi:hypothetical protein
MIKPCVPRMVALWKVGGIFGESRLWNFTPRAQVIVDTLKQRVFWIVGDPASDARDAQPPPTIRTQGVESSVLRVAFGLDQSLQDVTQNLVDDLIVKTGLLLFAATAWTLRRVLEFLWQEGNHDNALG